LKRRNDDLNLYWINHYAELGLNSEQIKEVLGIKKSKFAFRKWLYRNGIKTERAKSDVYLNLVKQNNL
jgi:hypothetical protein